MSLTFPEQFIAKYFGKMPIAVRVIAYLILLLLFVYTTLLPKFITGEVREKDENSMGTYEPYTLGKVSITIEGKEFITDPDKNGKWSLPLMNKLPQPQSITFWYYVVENEEKKAKKFDIVFNGMDLIRGKHLIVYYKPTSDPKFYVETEETIDNQKSTPIDDAAKKSMGSFFSATSAYAQVSNFSGNSKITHGLSIIDKKDIEKRAINVIKETIPNPNSQITYKSSLFKDIKISAQEESKLKSNIESEFRIAIDSWEWNNIANVDDLVELVAKYVTKFSPKVSKQVGYAYYGIQKSDGKWETRYFDNESKKKDGRPEEGNIVKAKGTVNIRAGYIEHKFLRGWVNKEKIGLIEKDDLLLVEEVKSIAGYYVWVKFRRILD